MPNSSGGGTVTADGFATCKAIPSASGGGTVTSVGFGGVGFGTGRGLAGAGVPAIGLRYAGSFVTM